MDSSTNIWYVICDMYEGFASKPNDTHRKCVVGALVLDSIIKSAD